MGGFWQQGNSRDREFRAALEALYDAGSSPEQMGQVVRRSRTVLFEREGLEAFDAPLTKARANKDYSLWGLSESFKRFLLAAREREIDVAVAEENRFRQAMQDAYAELLACPPFTVDEVLKQHQQKLLTADGIRLSRIWWKKLKDLLPQASPLERMQLQTSELKVKLIQDAFERGMETALKLYGEAIGGVMQRGMNEFRVED